MILGLTEALQIWSHFLAPGFLVFLRVGAAMFMLPAFGESMVPARVRLAVAIAFSAILLPLVIEDANQTLERQMVTGLAPVEILVGLTLGFALRLQIMALQVAATIAAQSTSLSQLLGGAIVDPQPAIGFIFLLAALALAAHLGLHAQIIAMFVRSYEVIGFGGSIVAADFASWATKAISASFDLALALAAPFVAISLLYNLALGVINRAMPQLMVAFVGAPAITLGALLLMALVAPAILAVWLSTFDGRLRTPFGVD